MDRRRTRIQELTTLRSALGLSSIKDVIFGVILDATGHYKTANSIDYVTRLRIIDHSLNNFTKEYRHRIEAYIYVFIYSEKVDSAPQIGRIGDIIRLENFHFSEHERKPKAVFHKKHSTWSIFDGRKNANNLPVMSSRKHLPNMSEYEKNELQKLRIWAENFFEKKSLYKMVWFKRPIPKRTRSGQILSMKDVDIIAKLLMDVSINKDKQFYQRLVFVDNERRIFLAELKGLLTGVDVGDVLKLRSVEIIYVNGEYKINFSSYSNFMVLQKHFYDAKDILKKTSQVKYRKKDLMNNFFEELHLGKRTKEMIGPNTYIYTSNIKKENPKTTKKNLEAIFPILKNFCYDVKDLEPNQTSPRSRRRKEALTGSAVLWKHANLEIISLKDLSKILKKKQFNDDKEYFKVRVTIESIENLKFENNFKIFSVKQNKTWEIKKSSVNYPDDAKIIFYNVFGIKDPSLSSKDPPMHSYLITYNENPKYIFDLWRLLPDPLAVKDWLNVESRRKDKFKKNLVKLIKDKKHFDLVLQIVKAEGGRPYLKLVDSIFWTAQ